MIRLVPSPSREAAVRPAPPGGVVRRIYANLARLLGGKAIAGLISLVYMVVAVRALGANDYGVLILVHTYVVTVGGIIEFPGWQAVVRYGAQAAEAGDEARLARLLRFTAIVEMIGGLLAVATAAALAPWVGRHLGWSQPALALAVPYSLAALATIRSTPAGLLQLLGRFDLLGFHNVVAPAVRLVGALVALAAGAGLRGFLIAWLAAALAEWASMWIMGLWLARRRLPAMRLFGPMKGAVAENPGIRWFMAAANADTTFSEVAQRASALVVGWVLNPAAAGLFAVAQRATSIIAQPAGNLGSAAYAELARLLAGGGRALDVRHAYAKAALIAVAIALPFVAAVGPFGGDLAKLIGGPQFARAGDVMVLLFAARAIVLAAPPASAALVALGRPGLSLFANSLAATALLPLLPAMVGRWGLSGAGWYALVQGAATVALLSALVWHWTAPGRSGAGRGRGRGRGELR